MALSDITKIDYSFKILSGKTLTSTDKQVYEEARASAFTIHYTQIWIDAIDSDPAVAVAAGIAEQKTLFTLTEDITVPSKKGWYASGETGWVPPRFGQGYNVRLYDNNDNEITSSDPMDWIWQYNPGHLFIQNNHSYATPFKITGYVYSGVDLSQQTVALYWRDPVSTLSNLPATGEMNGAVRLVLDEDAMYRWDQSTASWKIIAGGGGGGTARWRDQVDTYNDLPLSGNIDGDIRYVKDLTDPVYGNRLYRWNNLTSMWHMVMPGTHFHDDRYYTQADLDPAASTGNNVLDDRYYTEGELLAGALNTVYPTWADFNAEFDEDVGHHHTGVPGEGPLLDYNTLLNKPEITTAYWKMPAVSFSSLPASGNNDGDVRLTLNDSNIYRYHEGSTEWILVSSGIEKWKTPVATTGFLPLSGNSDGDVRLVLSENILYRWHSGDVEWQALQGTGGGGGTIIQNINWWEEDFDLAESQTVVALVNNTYEVGNQDILVYINGVLGRIDEDFTETSTTSITLLSPGEAGDRVTIVGKMPERVSGWMDAVDTYNDLPLTGNMNGDTRLVLDENIIYRWNSSISEWESVTVIQWQERFDLIEDQTVIDLTHTYDIGTDDIMVYINGLLGTIDEDYEETTDQRITLLGIGELGDRVTVVGKAFKGYEPSGGGGESAAADTVREEFTATTGQTVFNLDNTYVIGSSNLQVYKNGLLMRIGASEDYLETDNDTITFQYALDGGDEVVCLIVGSLLNDYTGEVDVLTATASQMAFDLSFTYNTGNQEVDVFRNGILMVLGASYDYVETDSDTITFNSGLTAGEVVVVRKSQQGYRPQFTYEEYAATAGQAAVDEFEVTSSLLPTTPADTDIAPESLRANNILIDVIIEGAELYDEEYRYFYDSGTSKKLIKMGGTGYTGYNLGTSNRIKIKIIKL